MGIKREPIFKGKVVSLAFEEHVLPDGRSALFEIVHHPGGATAIPVLDDGRIVLVRQYRPAVKQMVLELPAGKLDAGESPEECIRRELQEEIGYTPQRIEPLGEMWTAIGFCDEKIYLYVARDLKPVAMCHEPDEYIETVILSVEEILKLMASGQIIDGKTQLALFLYTQSPT